jgi:hypothetical protein
MMANSKRADTLPRNVDLVSAATQPSEEALRLHPLYKGKVQIHAEMPDPQSRRLLDLVYARRRGIVQGDPKTSGDGLRTHEPR